VLFFKIKQLVSVAFVNLLCLDRFVKEGRNPWNRCSSHHDVSIAKPRLKLPTFSNYNKAYNQYVPVGEKDCTDKKFFRFTNGKLGVFVDKT